MLASALIIGFSVLLLVYWFRYSCLLLLRTQTVSGAAPRVTPDSRFSIREIQALLKTGGELDPLHRSLQRDYQVLTYLLDHAAALGLKSFEDRLLVFDYKVMQGWYRLTKSAAPQQARQALGEMATILEVLVQKIGQQAGVQVEA